MHYVGGLMGRTVHNNDWHDDKAEKYQKIARTLKKTPKKNNIMTECAHLFYDEDFEEKLDDNPNLICCENGVFDLSTGEFRDGMYNDYVSKSTKIDYIPYDSKSKYTRQIEKFFSEIQTDTADRKYLKYLLGLSLSGVTPERFYIWSGGGGNGKSVLCKIIELALGEYAGTMPVNVVSSKRKDAGTASPELICLKGVRFVTLPEPDESSVLNMGVVKHYSGNDVMSIRGLFKDQIKMTPQWSLIMICNERPKLTDEVANDDGTWRRIRLLQFLSKFTEHPDPNENTEFNIDPLLSEKIIKWKESFLSLLIHYNQEFRKNNFIIDEPISVLKYTKEYQKNNDVVLQFLDIYIEPKSDSHIVFNELYIEFEDWYRGEFGSKPMTKPKLRNYLVKRFQKQFKKTAGKLLGYAIKSTDDDVDVDTSNLVDTRDGGAAFDDL
jgi:P4 family phage/plasmid primase-like protien